MLIIYFSNTNITKQIVEDIQEYTQATAIRLIPNIPYPTDFDTAKEIVVQQNLNNVLPKYTPISIDLSKQDIILLAYPVWDKHLPPVMRTFLTNHNLTDKVILPVNTHLGFGTGFSIDDLKNLAPTATVKEPLSIANSDMISAKQVIKDWLSQLAKVELHS